MSDVDPFDEGMPWSNEEPTAAPEEGQPAEPEASEPEQPTEEPEDVTSIRAKYKDDPDEAWKALAESQKYIGQLHQTQGDLQGRLDRLASLQEQQLALAQQQYANQQTPAFEDTLEDDPKLALTHAVKQYEQAQQLGDQNAQAYAEMLVDRAWKGWAQEELEEAIPWREAWQQAKIQQMIQAQTQPILAQTNEQTRAQKMGQLAREAPDIQQHKELINTILREDQYLDTMAKSGNPDFEYWALKRAYIEAKARGAATLGDAAQNIARAQADEAERAQNEAFVASAGNQVRDPAEPSIADELTKDWGGSGIYWGE